MDCPLRGLIAVRSKAEATTRESSQSSLANVRLAKPTRSGRQWLLSLRVVVVLDVVQFRLGRYILHAAQSAGAGDPRARVWLRVHTLKV